MFNFIGPQGTVKMYYTGHQAFNPSVNKVELYFQHISNAATIDSDKLEIPYG